MTTNDSIRRLLQSTRDLQSMDRHGDLIRDLAKSFVPDALTQQVKFAQELAVHFRENSPFQQLERMRIAWAEATGGLSAQVRAVQQVSEQFSKSLRASDIFQTAHNLREAFGGLELGAIQKAIFPSFRADVVGHALAALQEITKSIGPFDSAELANVTPKDISEATERLEAEFAPAIEGESVESKLDRILEAVGTSKESLPQKLFWQVLVALLVNLCAGRMQATAEGPVKQEITINVHVDARSLVVIALGTGIPQIVGDMGLVEHDVQIRSRPRRASRLLGGLELGDVVKIVSKGRQWSLVRHYDVATGTPTEGWILSRYLRPIR